MPNLPASSAQHDVRAGETGCGFWGDFVCGRLSGLLLAIPCLMNHGHLQVLSQLRNT